MDVAAENATELPRLGKPRIKLNVQANHTDEEGRQFPDPDYLSSRRKRNKPVRIGERHRWSTLCRNLDPGIAPSRLKAYIMREFDVMEKVLPSPITKQKQ